MTSDKFKKNAHLYLGITRGEFARRLAAGKIDFQILKSEIEQRSLELELETICEVALKQKSAEQLDKFDYLDDSSLS
jgi:hypothetical protein